MEKTKHLGLNQWALSDRIQMEDFNRDNALIDTAAGGKLGKMETILIDKSTGEEVNSYGHLAGTGSPSPMVIPDVAFFGER